MDILSFTLLADWTTTLTLIFGGCCSNALTLEQLTSQNPRSGSVITFAQFLTITLHGLPKFVEFVPYPRLKPRKIPLVPYLLQVLLFYAISLLNNAAFAYKIPMSVHIIFRSGGLIVSMFLGWLMQGRRYTIIQVLSVMLVTAGVVLTTLSASKPKREEPDQEFMMTSSTHTYSMGIAILSLALVLSGFLGIVQDRTYTKYTRSQPKATSSDKHDIPPWQESMFYLHFMSLPMFYFVRDDLIEQVQSLSAGPSLYLTLPSQLQSLTSLDPNGNFISTKGFSGQAALSIPASFLPLVLNTITQLVCVAGVHRLTSRVSSLTVTLVLVVRKAISLIISIMLFGGKGGQMMDEQSKKLMWTGATLVFLGTIVYSLASGQQSKSQSNKAKKE